METTDNIILWPKRGKRKARLLTAKWSKSQYFRQYGDMLVCKLLGLCETPLNQLQTKYYKQKTAKTNKQANKQLKK